MKRFHDSREERVMRRRQDYVRSHWYPRRGFGYRPDVFWEDDADDYPLGKYRKRHPADCGNSRCNCHYDKVWGKESVRRGRAIKQEKAIRDQLGHTLYWPSQTKNRCPHEFWGTVELGGQRQIRYFRCKRCRKFSYHSPSVGKVLWGEEWIPGKAYEKRIDERIQKNWEKLWNGKKNKRGG